LVELIDHAREFVTGLVTNGRMLTSLARDLKRVDLDYVQVSLESHLSEIHDRMVGVVNPDFHSISLYLPSKENGIV
jgi:MoaA/NifB/PqqE/SkfB family radical SAM enzyme